MRGIAGFSDVEIRGFLNRTKTQFRRVCSPQPTPERPPMIRWKGGMSWNGKMYTNVTPKYNIGERLFVKESYIIANQDDSRHLLYRATAPWESMSGPRDAWIWAPDERMPKAFARITLTVEHVRIQRVQAITNGDARAEGMPHAAPHRHGAEGMVFEIMPGEIQRDAYADRHNTGVNDCWMCIYRDVWQSLNAKRSPWERNDLVFVYTVKVVDS